MIGWKTKDIVTLIAISAAGLVFFSSCQRGSGAGYTGALEKVTLGAVAIESSSLVYVADALGMFKDNGLDATVVYFPDGVKASDDLMKGKVDAAAVADFIFVTRSFERNDLRVFGSIFRGDTFEVIARKDRGITKPADLKGKRIGLTRGTVLDFFMGSFLSMQGIAAGSVRLVDLKPSEIVNAISAGSVDAVIAWQPYAGRIRKDIGSNAVIWPAQSGQSYQFVLMAREEFVKERPVAVERVLKALLAAEKYCAEHTTEAQNLVASRIGHEPASLQSLWMQADFRVGIDQDLVTLMDDEARWLLKQKSDRSDIPNYLKYVAWQPLERIRPEAVRIIH